MMIMDKVERGCWKPVSVTPKSVGISHLFFVDDILLFAKLKASPMNIIMQVSNDFYEVSRLQVNVAKSKPWFPKLLLDITRLNYRLLLPPLC